MPTPTDPAIRAFLAYLRVERGLMPNTLDGYASDLTLFAVALGRPLAVETLTVADCRAWLTAQVTAGRATNTLCRRIHTLKHFLAFAQREGWRPDNLGAKLDAPRRPQSLPKALPEAVIARILDAPPLGTREDWRNRLVLSLLYATGLRGMEVVALRVSDLDLANQFVHVRHGKGNKARYVPFSTEVVTRLRDYWPSRARFRRRGVRHGIFPVRESADEPLFLTRQGAPLTVGSLRNLITAHCRRVGVAEHVRPHLFRHSFATHRLRRGLALLALRDLLGHASVATTQIYTSVALDDLVEAYDATDPRGNGAPPRPGRGMRARPANPVRGGGNGAGDRAGEDPHPLPAVPRTPRG